MLKKIVKYLFVWRLATIIPAILAISLLPVRDCCQNFGGNLSIPYLFNIWANFAGGDFLALAQHSYGLPLPTSTYIFFPLFPWLIGTFATLFSDYLASGLIVSHLSLIFGLFILYKLIFLDYKEKIARTTLVILMLFPTAFFFGSVYTESFFLFLVVSSFYLARKKLYFPACLLALLASATRFAGIFLWPALAWEMWQTHIERTKRDGFDSTLIWLLLPPLGLLAYMKFLSVKVGDPLFFMKVSPDFGPNLVVSKLILLHQVFFRYAKMLLFSDRLTSLYFVVLSELLVGVLFLVLIIVVLKRMRASYGIYALLSYLIPTFTGTFTNLPRFVLTIFPAFIVIALWFEKQPPFIKHLYLSVSLALSAIFIALFTRGYFVG